MAAAARLWGRSFIPLHPVLVRCALSFSLKKQTFVGKFCCFSSKHIQQDYWLPCPLESYGLFSCFLDLTYFRTFVDIYIPASFDDSDLFSWFYSYILKSSIMVKASAFQFNQKAVAEGMEEVRKPNLICLKETVVCMTAVFHYAINNLWNWTELKPFYFHHLFNFNVQFPFSDNILSLSYSYPCLAK